MKTVSATVTSKGQVTIPKVVRRSLNVSAGDGVNFVVRDDGVVELRRRPATGPRLFGRFAAYSVAPDAAGDRESAIDHAADRDRLTRR